MKCKDNINLRFCFMEFRVDIYTLLYLKWITNKDLLYSTINSDQHYVTT